MHEALGESAAQGARAIADIFRRYTWRIALVFLGLLLPLWAFVELADEVHELESFLFDDPLLWRARALAGPGLDRFFGLVSAIGYQYGVIPADILIVLGLLFARRWREASFAAAAFSGSALLNLATKQFFQRDRPMLWMSIAPESTFSFPSGHAMGSMTLAVVVFLLAWHTRWRAPVAVLAALFVALVGASRIYLGVHYPSDILGGWMAASTWTVAVYLVLFRTRLRPWSGSEHWIQR